MQTFSASQSTPNVWSVWSDISSLHMEEKLTTTVSSYPVIYVQPLFRDIIKKKIHVGRKQWRSWVPLVEWT